MANTTEGSTRNETGKTKKTAPKKPAAKAAPKAKTQKKAQGPAKTAAGKKTAAPSKQTATGTAGTGKPAPKDQAAPPITSEERHRLIAEAAYLRAEKRGFAGGDPSHDWLEAEREIDAALTVGKRRPRKP